MRSAAKLRRESNAVDQINPTPILDTKIHPQIEVGGKGGAYKYVYIYIYIHEYRSSRSGCNAGQRNHAIT